MSTYLCDPHIFPAIMPENLAELSIATTAMKQYAPLLHLDVMDGIFAPTLCWPLNMQDLESEFKQLPSALSDMNYEVHLMVQKPLELGLHFARAGAQRIIAHKEVFEDVDEASRVLMEWKSAGAPEVGLALKLETPLSELQGLIQTCDVVQLMSIPQIGYQGTKFDEHTLSRIEELRAMAPECTVSVDGGVTEVNIEDIVRAGANRIVVGGALKNAPDPEAAYARLHERAIQGCKPVTR